MLKERVEELLTEVFAEHKSLFLIDFSISPDNKIKVVIDGDAGVSLNDCILVSRHVEHQLDREEADFSLEVTSPGAAEPVVHQRQYNKNIGRKLKVKTISGETLEGKLEEITEQGIKLQWKQREPKPVGKGKRTVTIEKEILFSDIAEAKVVIIF
ncbi:ribosome assembly cofactor RimP [Sinomicrobium pectinilyticum]|uniref:Ribosome maturation factor RimP n=1 Tax=Sinomicrobium pectinilyticum TaxID=1084421 RepID=A0A3N0F089_SINP1|nr:ribosome assembly cofactor RimP [Sinomicrobium pectinilyticum]RNL93514.1 ribosome assembly cofactor RimP [Sinomicrobium pectinilyticum]